MTRVVTQITPQTLQGNFQARVDEVGNGHARGRVRGRDQKTIRLWWSEVEIGQKAPLVTATGVKLSMWPLIMSFLENAIQATLIAL